jgi:hypothetical protein
VLEQRAFERHWASSPTTTAAKFQTQVSQPAINVCKSQIAIRKPTGKIPPREAIMLPAKARRRQSHIFRTEGVIQYMNMAPNCSFSELLKQEMGGLRAEATRPCYSCLKSRTLICISARSSPAVTANSAKPSKKGGTMAALRYCFTCLQQPCAGVQPASASSQQQLRKWSPPPPRP